MTCYYRHGRPSICRRIIERAFHIFLLFTDQCRKEWCCSRWLILLLLFSYIHHLIKCFKSSTLTVHSDCSILSYISNDNELALALPLTLKLLFNCEAVKGTSTDKHQLPVVY